MAVKKEKYQMSQQENILYAKRNLVDSIYSSAKLEGLNVTFPETYAIVEKLEIQNADVSEISTVLNLKHAWQYILSTIDKKLDLEYLLKVHEEIAKDEALFWGELRTGNLGVSGTDYIPPIPTEEDVVNKLQEFEKIDSVVDRSIRRMVWMIKSQLFWDGNKRTATLIANKDLIQHGRGILAIKEKDLVEFNTLLSDYYTKDAEEPLIDFLYDKAIDGIDIRSIS